nr:unnamed protein product [Callosobruchus chinensis]
MAIRIISGPTLKHATFQPLSHRARLVTSHSSTDIQTDSAPLLKESRQQLFMKIHKMHAPAIPTYGVLQGTILGPILFLLCVNDIFIIKSKGTISSFADDTVIFYQVENWKDL